MTPSISIIVPCYKQDIYLDECLNSVLVQQYQNWECLIIDDGSPDNTEEIAQKWPKKDARFQYFKLENGGVSAARNFGLSQAKGELILALDADDKISETYISDAILLFKKNDSIGIVYSNLQQFGIKNDLIQIDFTDLKTLLLGQSLYCSAIFKKNLALKVGGYDVNMKYGLEDWEFWINVIANNQLKTAKIKETGFYYRIKEVSRQQDLQKSTEKRKMMRNYIYEKHQNLFLKYFEIPIILIRKVEELKNPEKYIAQNIPIILVFKALLLKIKYYFKN